MSVLEEIYPPKQMRTTRPRMGSGKVCPECHRWAGHVATCPNVTTEMLIAQIERAAQAEEWARERARKYLDQLSLMHGKLALLKHENNKLRRKIYPDA